MKTKLLGKIALTREEDIEIRGKDHLVHDYDGSITTLQNAEIWYSHDGNYMEPSTYNSSLLENICVIS